MSTNGAAQEDDPATLRMCRTISAPSYANDAMLLDEPCPPKEVTPPQVTSGAQGIACKHDTHIGLKELREHFVKPRWEAARCLQISVNCLKAVCRHAGVERWPFRKLQSLVSLTQGDRLAPEEQACIQAEIDEVLANPNHEVSSKLVKMKLSNYKERYKERMMRGRATQASHLRAAKPPSCRSVKHKVIKSQGNQGCSSKSAARVQGTARDRLFQGPEDGGQDSGEEQEDDATVPQGSTVSTQAQPSRSPDLVGSMQLTMGMGPLRQPLHARADNTTVQQQHHHHHHHHLLPLQQPPGECSLWLCSGKLLSSTGEPSSPGPSWATSLFCQQHAPQPAPLHAPVLPAPDGLSASAGNPDTLSCPSAFPVSPLPGNASNEGPRQETPLLQPPPLHDLLDALDQVQEPPGLAEFESALFMPDSINRGIDALFDNGKIFGLVCPPGKGTSASSGSACGQRGTEVWLAGVLVSLLLCLAMLAGPRVLGRAELLLNDGGSSFDQEHFLRHKESIDCQKKGVPREGALWPVKIAMLSSG